MATSNPSSMHTSLDFALWCAGQLLGSKQLLRCGIERVCLVPIVYARALGVYKQPTQVHVLCDVCDVRVVRGVCDEVKRTLSPSNWCVIAACKTKTKKAKTKVSE